MHRLSLDIGKLDVAFISRNTQTPNRFKIASKRWKVNWGGKLLTIQDTTRWLGVYLDPFLNWHAHIKIRVQQGLWRQQKVARFMQCWGINSKLARTVAWSTSMATAAYGIEAIWEGQTWIVQSFHKLTAQIGRDVSEFGSLGRWLTRSSHSLWARGQHVEQTKPLALHFAVWLDEDESSVHNDKESLHLYTDASFRTCAAFGWASRDSSIQEIDSGSGSVRRLCTAFDREVAAIENGKNALLRCRQPFKHVTVHSDSTAAIARVQHNKRGPGQSRAVKLIWHVQRLRGQGKRFSISQIKGHNGNTGNDRSDALAGRGAEDIHHSTSCSHQVSVAWMNQKISELYSEAATLELGDRGKHTSIPPPPKESTMDQARNREARISSQLRTNHWLSGVYLMRIGKRAHAGCWFCEDRYDNIQPPTKNAKVVVIGKPGKRDLTNPKSYRCISLMSNIAKLTEKVIAQYLTLEGESNGWWHRTQFGSRPGRNTSD
jgi:ribonuclease HI